MNETTNNASRIAELNDTLRSTFLGGTILATQGIKALPEESQRAVLEAVRTFNDFTEENDPYGEHDFGSFECQGTCIFWKIDYYDSTLTYGSEDPSDPTIAKRVLTIMLASEY